MPGSAAAMPAPQIRTFSPRPAAPRAYSATASGERCAERTSSSWAMSRLASSSRQGCMRPRSDSEPIRIPTSTCSATCIRLSLRRFESDVGAIAHALPADLLAGSVGSLARRGDRRAERAHVQDAPAARYQCLVAHRCAGLEYDRAGRFGLGDAGNRRALVGACRVVAGREHDRHAGLLRDAQLYILERAVCNRAQRLEQVAFESRQDGLSLGIAEAYVELEHLQPVVCTHQTGVENPDKGVPAIGQLGQYGSVHLFEDDLDLIRADTRHRGVRAHAAGIRTLVAVVGTLEVLGRRQREGLLAGGQHQHRQLLAYEELLEDGLAGEGFDLLPRPGQRTGVGTDEDALPGR